MELSTRRQRILSSDKTTMEKAEAFLLDKEVCELSQDEWTEFIAGIPEDVKKQIGKMESAGTPCFICTYA